MPDLREKKKSPNVIQYETSTEWTRSHQGVARSPKKIDVEVVCPPPFCDERDDLWSPEEYFVSSVEMCLMMTFLYFAHRGELPFLSYKSHATGTVEFVDGKAKFTKIDIYPQIEALDDRNARKIRLMLKAADRNCLVSNSIDAEVRHYPGIIVSRPTSAEAN
jgi:organic hydroperoxide reductase OsmC/OhrA